MKNLLCCLILLLTCFLGSAKAQSDVPGTTQYPASLDGPGAFFIAANNARSTLAAALTDSAASLTLVDASAFPSSGNVSINKEIIYFTSKTGNTLNGLLRGRDGTTAGSALKGATVEIRYIARYQGVLADAIRNIQAKLGTGALIDPARIGTGAVSLAEFNQLDGVNGPIATQQFVLDSISGGSIVSVFGRTGAVVALSGDYDFSKISGSIADSQVPDTITIDSLTRITSRNYSDLQGIPSSFTPSAHATSHRHGGADEVATATPAANAIPKAGSGGTLDSSWLPDLSGTYQPLDSDLSAIAGLSPTNDDIIQRKSGAWAIRSPAQFKLDLALTKSDVGLGNVTNTQQQPISDVLTDLAGLTQAADKGLYFNSSITASTFDLTAFARSLLDDADAGAARTTMGLGALAQLSTVGSSQIDDDAVSFAKLQNIATSRLLGRSTAGSGNVEEISIGSGLDLSAGTLSVSGGSGANAALSNLASVAINTSLLSDADNADDLGSASKRWKDIHFAGKIRAKGSEPAYSFDSTTATADQYAGVGVSGGVLTFHGSNAAGNASVLVLNVQGNIGSGAISVGSARLFADSPSATTPNISPRGVFDPDTGLGSPGDDQLSLIAGGVEAARFRSSGLLVGATAHGTSAVNVIGIKNGTAPTTSIADGVQLFSQDFAGGDARLYVKSETGGNVIIGNEAVRTETANGAATLIQTVSQSITLSTSGPTTESTIEIPANSLVLAVTARITATITGTDATSLVIDGNDTSDDFATLTALTAGTTTVGLMHWTGNAVPNAAAQRLRLSLDGAGDLTPSAGSVRVTVHYIQLGAPTS